MNPRSLFLRHGLSGRLIDGWQRETSADSADRTRLEALLSPWEAEERPVPYAVLDAILSMPPKRRSQALNDFTETVYSTADNATWERLLDRVGIGL